MKRAFGYNRRGRDPRGFIRWLGLYRRALLRMCRGRPCRGALLWTGDDAAALLAAGFPALLAVPEPLFADCAALFPDRCRLAAADTEDETLARLRLVEERFGLRFDWDAFLAACEKRRRRVSRLRVVAAALEALAPPPPDPRTPQTALKSLLRKE